jgi:hypothetical protein
MNVVDISEIPSRVSRRDLSFYLVLFFFVLPFWSAIPLAWAFVIHSLRTGKIWLYSRGSLVLFVIALAEVGIALLFSFPHPA